MTATSAFSGRGCCANPSRCQSCPCGLAAHLRAQGCQGWAAVPELTFQHRSRTIAGVAVVVKSFTFAMFNDERMPIGSGQERSQDLHRSLGLGMLTSDAPELQPGPSTQAWGSFQTLLCCQGPFEPCMIILANINLETHQCLETCHYGSSHTHAQGGPDKQSQLSLHPGFKLNSEVKVHLSGWQSRMMVFTVERWSLAAGRPASLMPPHKGWPSKFKEVSRMTQNWSCSVTI